MSGLSWVLVTAMKAQMCCCWFSRVASQTVHYRQRTHVQRTCLVLSDTLMPVSRRPLAFFICGFSISRVPACLMVHKLSQKGISCRMLC